MGYGLLLSLTILAGAFAVVLGLGWLANLALVLLLASWLVVRDSSKSWTTSVSWCLILVAALALPGELEGSLLKSIHESAARGTSGMLDLFGIAHFRAPESFELETGTLRMKDLLDGRDGVCFLIALATVWVIITGDNFLPGLLTVLSAILWAWLVAFLRLLGTIWLRESFQVDISSGAGGVVFRLGLLIIAVVGIALTKIALSLILRPFPVKTITSGPFHEWFNLAVCWPASSPTGKKRKADNTSSNATSKPAGLAKIVTLATFLLLPIVGVVGGLQVFHVGPWHRDLKFPSVPENRAQELVSEKLLPTELGKFKFAKFLYERFFAGSKVGESVSSWQFAKADGTTVTISARYPLAGSVPAEDAFLDSRYQLVGKVSSQLVALGDSQEQVRVYSCKLIDDMSQQSLLSYIMIDVAGETTELQSRTTPWFGIPTPFVPYGQLTLLTPIGSTFNEMDEKELNGLLADAYLNLRSTFRQLGAEIVDVDAPSEEEIRAHNRIQQAEAEAIQTPQETEDADTEVQ